MRSVTFSSASGEFGVARPSRFPGPAWASRSLSRSSRCMGARSGWRARSATVRLSTSRFRWLKSTRRHCSAAMPEVSAGGYASSMVLVADDNEVAQRLCRRVLEKAGYSVLFASDGLQAVDLALAQMRIVIASAHSMASDRERFLAAGADDVLSKPFRLGDLIDVVQKLTARPSA